MLGEWVGGAVGARWCGVVSVCGKKGAGGKGRGNPRHRNASTHETIQKTCGPINDSDQEGITLVTAHIHRHTQIHSHTHTHTRTSAATTCSTPAHNERVGTICAPHSQPVSICTKQAPKQSVHQEDTQALLPMVPGSGALHSRAHFRAGLSPQVRWLVAAPGLSVLAGVN